MNLKNTLTGLAITGGMLLPAQSKALDVSESETVSHNHNHILVGGEVDSHKMLGHAAYTYELLDHWSIGAGVGLGADHHGAFAGSAEAIGSFHKGLITPLFVAAELGLGAEWIDNHADPVVKISGLVGVRLNHVLGLAVGPTVSVTPKAIQPSATVNLAIGF